MRITRFACHNPSLLAGRWPPPVRGCQKPEASSQKLPLHALEAWKSYQKSVMAGIQIVKLFSKRGGFSGRIARVLWKTTNI
jgi:hypothetical protein